MRSLLLCLLFLLGIVQPGHANSRVPHCSSTCPRLFHVSTVVGPATTSAVVLQLPRISRHDSARSSQKESSALQFVQLVVLALIAWLFGYFTLYLLGLLLSEMTLRGIATNRLDAKNFSARMLRRVYRWVIELAGIYYYVSLPMLLVLATVLLVSIAYACFYTPAITLPLMLLMLFGVFGAFVTVFSGIRTALMNVPDAPGGMALNKDASPNFWSLVNSVAKEVDTRPVDEIWVTPNADMCVFERGSWLSRRLNRGHRVLVLGVSLLHDFQADSFRSVLSHEYAHFRHRDTAGGDIALRVQYSMHRFVEAIARRRKIRFWDVSVHFLRLFSHMFSQLTLGASRLGEVLADRTAVSLYGTAPFTDGLKHVIRRGVEFDLRYAQSFRQTLNPNTACGLTEYKPIVDAAVQKIYERETTSDDSHPAPKTRFAMARRWNVSRQQSKVMALQYFDENGSSLIKQMGGLLMQDIQREAAECQQFNRFLISLITQKIQRGHDDSDLRINRSLFAMQIGDFQSAIIDLNQALFLNGENLELRFSRAQAHSFAGDSNAAIADLQHIRTHGQDEKELFLSANLMLGKVLVEANRLREASGVFKYASSIDPDSCFATMAVIDIANRSGEVDSPSQKKLLAVANQRWPELMRSDERPTQRDLEQAKCLGAHADESLVPAVLGTFVLMAIMVVGLAGISYMIFHPPGSRTQVASVDPASEQEPVTTRTEAKSTHSKSRSNDAADRNVAGISSRHQGLANQQAQPKTKRPEHRPTRIPFHEEYQNRSERIEQSRREFELNKAEHLKAMKDSARRSEPGLAVRSKQTNAGREAERVREIENENQNQVRKHEFARKFAKIKLRAIQSAVEKTSQATGKSPASILNDSDRQLSWRVHILPYLNHRALYEKFRLDERWDSEHNLRLLSEIPRNYDSGFKSGLTSFRSVISADAGVDQNANTVRFDPDSESVSILFAGFGSEVPWTQPEKVVDPKNALQEFGLADFAPTILQPGLGPCLECEGGIHPTRFLALVSRTDNDHQSIAGMLLDKQSIRLPLPNPPSLSTEGSYVVEPATKQNVLSTLKQIGAAIHKLEMPSDTQLSWRVHLLPHIGEEHLYNQFDLNQSWSHDHNYRLINQIPKLFQFGARQGRTRFHGVDKVMPTHRKNGTRSNDSKLAVLFGNQDITWTRPGDLEVEFNARRSSFARSRFDFDQQSGLVSAHLMGESPAFGLLSSGRPVLIRDPTISQLINLLNPGSTLELPQDQWEP